MVSDQQILIALGANLPSEAGSPQETLMAALSALGREGYTLVATSRFYATPCFPAGFGPDYVNACARITGPAEPQAVLAALHRVEAQFGRERQRRWGSRTVDLDLIAIGETVMPDAVTHSKWRNIPTEEQRGLTPDQLILPHPRVQDRAFVLVPLCDIAANWRHPLLEKTASEMCEALPQDERAEVVPM